MTTALIASRLVHDSGLSLGLRPEGPRDLGPHGGKGAEALQSDAPSRRSSPRELRPDGELDKDIHRALVDKFGEDLVFRTTIARSVKHRESTLYRKTIFEHAPGDQASRQYAELLKEMINRGRKGAFSARSIRFPTRTLSGRIAPDDGLDEIEVGSVVNG